VVISEADLLRFATCPLGDPREENKLVQAARILWRSQLLRGFEGLPLSTLEHMRERYTAHWNKLWFGSAIKALPVSGPYWEGPKKAATVSRRLFQFFTRYQVLQPEQVFELHVDKYTIQVGYAIVAKRSNEYPYVLVLHGHAALHKTSPDVLSLARLVHASKTTFHNHIGLLHVPMLRGEPWKQKQVDEFQAERYVQALATQMSANLLYPAPGPHCLGCISKPCMGVFPNVR
jgi:hypothetical protein